MNRSLGLTLPLTLTVGVLACAQGTTRNATPGGDGDQAPADGGALLDASAPGDGDGSGDGDLSGDGDGPGDGDSSGDGDALHDAAVAGDGDAHDAGVPDAGGPEPMCDAVNGCFAATYLGQFNGDESGQPVLMQQASGSAWLSAKVIENSNSSVPVSMRVTLTGEAGADYDVFVYVPSDASSAAECSTVSYQASTPGTANEQLDAQWGDVTLGDDDTRNVSIEVRHVSGPCSSWTVQVTRP